MICDHLVIGTHDKLVSERLQLEPGLNLQLVEKMVRHRAAVQEQQYALKHSVDAKLQMNSARSHTSKHSKQLMKPPKRSQLTTEHLPPKTGNLPAKCRRCGRDSHPKQQGPAIEML